jgi:hypothetical protein
MSAAKRWLPLVLATVLPLVLAGCGSSKQTAHASAVPPLGKKVHALEVQNLRLRQALLAQLAQQLTQTAHVVAVDGGAALAARTPAERLLARAPAIGRLVEDYFARQVLAHAPGKAGERGRKLLARFFPAGSPALARARYLALGSVDERAMGQDGQKAIDPVRGSVAVVRSLTTNRSLDRATVVVWPAVEYQVWLDSSGRPQWGGLPPGEVGEPWGIALGAAPHRLTLVKSDGRWLITDDFSLDAEIPATLRSGGAPDAVWRGEQRRITRQADRRLPAPAGVTATFQQLVALLNERRFAQTAQLYAGGEGLSPSAFQHPNGSWHLRLLSVWHYNPLSFQAVANPGVCSVVVSIAGPQDLYIAGGGAGLSGAYTLRQSNTGRWLITGAGTAEFGAPSPY